MDFILLQNGESPSQDVIEAKFCSNQTNEILFTKGIYTFKINMTCGSQYNRETGTVCEVRRRPVFVSEAGARLHR